PAFELDLLLERNLRAGKQADRDVCFSQGGKTARERVIELRRYELVSNVCGSGLHMVQTVVTHRQHSLIGTPRSLSLRRNTPLAILSPLGAGATRSRSTELRRFSPRRCRTPYAVSVRVRNGHHPPAVSGGGSRHALQRISATWCRVPF